MRDAASSYEEPQSNMLELSTHNRTVQVTASSDFRMHILWPENVFVGLLYTPPPKKSILKSIFLYKIKFIKVKVKNKQNIFVAVKN